MIRPDRWKYTVTQLYKGRLHGGVDIAPPAGKKPPLYSPVNGKVVQVHKNGYLYDKNGRRVSKDKVSGNFVVIKATLRYHYLGHLANDSIKVRVGQKVKEDQHIANFGKSGKATGVHCHWEVWFELWKRFVQDPLKVLARRKNKRLYKKYTGK